MKTNMRNMKGGDKIKEENIRGKKKNKISK